MPRRADFHSRFARALEDPTIDSQPLLGQSDAFDQRRRFDIYRNNRASSLIDALRNTYPAVCTLVGEAFFKTAARGYIDRHPPTGPVMAEFGGEFASYLQTLQQTEPVPYLHDIALLEWHQLQAYHCADAPILDLQTLAEKDVQALPDLRLDSHPSLFTLQSRWPIGTIRTICTSQDDSAPDPSSVDMNRSEAVVVTRPALTVLTNVVPASGQLFLSALVRGSTIGEAAESALSRDENFNTGEHLAGLLSLGAFSKLSDNT
jgi:hypothetical protein